VLHDLEVSTMSSTIPIEDRRAARYGTSAMTEENSHNDETENRGYKRTECDPDFETLRTTFDILALDEGKTQKPTFTRALLHRMNINVRRVLGLGALGNSSVVNKDQ
jgi:hypothetical protein